MDIDNLFNDTTLLIIIGIMILFLIFSKEFRDIVRWIIFLPLSFGIALLLNFINIADMVVGLLFKKISYAVSIIVDTITISQDVFFVLLCAKIIAPNKRIGVIVASVSCLLVESYHMYNKKICTIFPIGYENIENIDWTNAAILLGASIFIIFLFIISCNNNE